MGPVSVERGVTRAGEPARMRAAGLVCGLTQGPVGCDRPVFSRGLCRRHYRMRARGAILPESVPVVGVTPSGHGRWGVMDVDPDGRVVCHECGRSFVHLGVHVGMMHDGVAAYRRAHGLPRSQPLTSPEHHARLLSEVIDIEAATARVAATRSPVSLQSVDGRWASAMRMVGLDRAQRAEPGPAR